VYIQTAAALDQPIHSSPSRTVSSGTGGASVRASLLCVLMATMRGADSSHVRLRVGLRRTKQMRRFRPSDVPRMLHPFHPYGMCPWGTWAVARAKPALEPDHSTLDRANPYSLLVSRRGSVPLSSAGFAGAISDCSPRTHGAQPVAVLRLGLPDRSPRTAGPQPRDVLRLAVRPGGRVRKGGEAPLRVERTESTPRV